jgi:hypothetical protein
VASERTQTEDVLPSQHAPSLEVMDEAGFKAAPIPKVAARPPRHASCCLPHASPVSETRAGKQKTALKDRSKQLIFLMKFGAGEGIRTLDPNLARL